MKQLIIRRMTAIDYFLNIFFKFRFWFFRIFISHKLYSISLKKKKGWTMTFEDDFDKISWDTKAGKKWKVAQGWGEFHPDFPHQYDGSPELVNGTSCARFTVKYNPKEFPDDRRTGAPITINHQRSLISTTISFRQQYGRFECRCNIPFDKGVWPAFWLYGRTWPPEIDIFELYGGEDGIDAGVQEINLHYGNVKEGTKDTMRAWRIPIATNPIVRHFHEFAVEWSEKKMVFFTDGIKVFRYTNRSVLKKWYNVPQAKMHIIVNHGIQPEHVPTHNKDYYSEFLVDYVRVYKKIKKTMTALTFIRKGEAKIAGVKVGLPGTKTYKSKTPKKIRFVGEVFLFAGFAIGALAMPLGLPAWVIAAGSVAGYLGKKVTKMVGE